MNNNIINSCTRFVIGPHKISRMNFIWRTCLFTLSIPESLNLIFGTAPFGSQPLWAMIFICVAMFISICGSLGALMGRLNDLEMSGYWILSVICAPVLIILWIYLVFKPAAVTSTYSVN